MTLARVRATGGAGLAASVLVLALLLAGCGGGEDPDVGSDDSVAVGGTAATVDGSASTAPSTSTAAGGEIEVSNELPDGWPDDLPVPDDAVLELSQRTEQDDGSVLLTADFTVDDGGANVYTAFLEGLEGEGTTVLQRSSGGTESGFVGSISFSRDAYSGNVAVDEATGRTILSVSVVLDD